MVLSSWLFEMRGATSEVLIVVCKVNDSWWLQMQNAASHAAKKQWIVGSVHLNGCRVNVLVELARGKNRCDISHQTEGECEYKGNGYHSKYAVIIRKCRTKPCAPTFLNVAKRLSAPTVLSLHVNNHKHNEMSNIHTWNEEMKALW